MKKIIPILLLAILLVGCGQDPQQKETTQKPQTHATPKSPTEASSPKQTAKESEAMTIKNDFKRKTTTGKTFVISREHKTDRATVTISGEGFKHNNKLTLNKRASIQDVLTADLDGDGFDEIYLIFNAKESSDPNALLAGFVSYKDRSFGEIYVPIASAKLLKGYHGGDKFYLKDGQLIREFPINGDVVTKLVYTLHAGEAGFQLQAKRLD